MECLKVILLTFILSFFFEIPTFLLELLCQVFSLQVICIHLRRLQENNYPWPEYMVSSFLFYSKAISRFIHTHLVGVNIDRLSWRPSNMVPDPTNKYPFALIDDIGYCGSSILSLKIKFWRVLLAATIIWIASLYLLTGWLIDWYSLLSYIRECMTIVSCQLTCIHVIHIQVWAR